MMRFLSTARKQFVFHRAHQEALHSLKAGNKDGWSQLYHLLEEMPTNVLLRHEVLMWAKKLDIQVELPDLHKTEHCCRV